jgi:hypothetical protein
MITREVSMCFSFFLVVYQSISSSFFLACFPLNE